MVSNGFVINPYFELLPDYKISPFATIDLINNRSLPESKLCDVYFKSRFQGMSSLFTVSGKQAINYALSYYDLTPNDCVTILTTSGNFYISSCVTSEIEKYCKWSRVIQKNTRVIFVNHEFGYPFLDLKKIQEYNLPIIEDCAHSFFSIDEENLIGTVGDFVIYSFPKIFPIQLGALLLFKPLIRIKNYKAIDIAILEYIKKVVSYYIPFEQKIKQKRQLNYYLLTQKMKVFGFQEYFKFNDKIVPGVFMFKVNDDKIDLPKLKKYFYAHGVQCSVFYGTNSFFIPCHQNLVEEDLDYFTSIISSFLKEN